MSVTIPHVTSLRYGDVVESKLNLFLGNRVHVHLRIFSPEILFKYCIATMSNHIARHV